MSLETDGEADARDGRRDPEPWEGAVCTWCGTRQWHDALDTLEAARASDPVPRFYRACWGVCRNEVMRGCRCPDDSGACLWCHWHYHRDEEEETMNEGSNAVQAIGAPGVVDVHAHCDHIVGTVVPSGHGRFAPPQLDRPAVWRCCHCGRHVRMNGEPVESCDVHFRPGCEVHA